MLMFEITELLVSPVHSLDTLVPITRSVFLLVRHALAVSNYVFCLFIIMVFPKTITYKVAYL